MIYIILFTFFIYIIQFVPDKILLKIKIYLFMKEIKKQAFDPAGLIRNLQNLENL